MKLSHKKIRYISCIIAILFIICGFLFDVYNVSLFFTLTFFSIITSMWIVLVASIRIYELKKIDVVNEG